MKKQKRIYLLISKREDCFESSSFVLRLTSPSRLDSKPFLSVVKLRASWILKTIDSSVEAGILRSLWRGREISWLLLRCGGCGLRTFGSCSFIGCSFRKRWQTVALDEITKNYDSVTYAGHWWTIFKLPFPSPAILVFGGKLTVLSSRIEYSF